MLRVRNNRVRLLILATLAAALIAVILISAAAYPDSAVRPTSGQRNVEPSWQLPLGTDWLGRDMFARTMKGMALSLLLGLAMALVSTLLSALFALAAAMGPKWMDRAVGWLVDVTIGLPQIIASLLIAFAVGGGVPGVILAVSLTQWPPLARLLRAEILKVREEPYVAVSRARGRSAWWVAWHHICPAIAPHLIVGFVLMFPHSILHESALTFIGFGLEPTTPSLGIILSEGLRFLSTGQWWLVLGPIVLLVALATLLDACGDRLRQLLSPASRHE